MESLIFLFAQGFFSSAGSSGRRDKQTYKILPHGKDGVSYAMVCLPIVLGVRAQWMELVHGVNEEMYERLVRLCIFSRWLMETSEMFCSGLVAGGTFI